MKFQLLWKDGDKTREVFEEFVKNGWRFRGAKLCYLKEVDIVNTHSGAVENHAYLVNCVGSVVSYWRHKLSGTSSVFVGWDK
jgi:hypothetical protein